MTKLKGLATGIGSLPHKDADSALDLIFNYLPQVPFWPQLHRRDIREGMIAQFSEGMPALKMTPEGLNFEFYHKDKELERFYEHIIANDTDYFKITPEFALGLYAFYKRLEKQDLAPIEFIKCQIAGPFTFSASINNEEGIALLYDPIFIQAFTKGLVMKALWQIKLFKKFGKPVLVFIDEPYLACFGSAYTPLNREDVVKGLTDITQSIKSEGAMTGIHCCGNTDWSMLMEVPGLDIINFDAFSFQEKLLLYAQDLKKFLQRGGKLCWGIVPTQQIKQETAGLLADKINSGIEVLVNKGLEKELVLDNLMLSPSCGLGTLTVEQSSGIFKLLSELSDNFRK